MDAAESRRKLASLAAIGLVIALSAWLRPSSPTPVADLLPSTSVGVVPGSYRGPTPVRPRPERGRSGVRSGSEFEYTSTQLAGMNELPELRTLRAEPAATLEPLASRLLRFESGAPLLVQDFGGTSRRGSVSRALTVAGRETGNAFRIAGRVLRTAF
jgi:hypothetical protein